MNKYDISVDMSARYACVIGHDTKHPVVEVFDNLEETTIKSLHICLSWSKNFIEGDGRIFATVISPRPDISLMLPLARRMGAFAILQSVINSGCEALDNG